MTHTGSSPIRLIPTDAKQQFTTDNHDSRQLQFGVKSGFSIKQLRYFVTISMICFTSFRCHEILVPESEKEVVPTFCCALILDQHGLILR